MNALFSIITGYAAYSYLFFIRKIPMILDESDNSES